MAAAVVANDHRDPVVSYVSLYSSRRPHARLHVARTIPQPEQQLGPANGVPLHVMSKRVGHSSDSVTGDIRDHYGEP